MRVWPGSPYPPGATWEGRGVNVALFSAPATKVERCLFETVDAPSEVGRMALPERTDQVWHAYRPEVLPGQLHGYRGPGPDAPPQGHRFTPHNGLLDPYATSIGRDGRWADELLGYRRGDPDADRSFDERDSAADAPLAVVIDPAFPWGDDRPLRTPWHKTLIYELHVNGCTQRHPAVPERLRGTSLGLATEAAVRHLTSLGTTAVERMPVHHFLNARSLVDRGLNNSWGSSPLACFAPASRYTATRVPQDAVQQFKLRVSALHAADIDVLLDVVDNHTAEGSQLGPTVSMRGVDNAASSRLSPEAPRDSMDLTGCGHSPPRPQPRVLQLIMDSLRYGVTEMHVDGFRFDRASTLGRDLLAVDRRGAFFDIIHQDPGLSQVKRIAEPWDVGTGGSQVGTFPIVWGEGNGRSRDPVRQFWKGDGGTLSEFATRLSGSSDLSQHDGRKPSAGLNLITCHDGFTLHDLVGYNAKHNDATGDENQDGTHENHSGNCGAEGPIDDPAINALRWQQQRHFLTTLVLSQGVPMLLAGDELGQTQQGNHNTSCQDHERTWLNWPLTDAQRAWGDFVRAALQVRRTQPVFRRRKFFYDRAIHGEGIQDISWFDASGQDMTEKDWQHGYVRGLGVRLAGDLIGGTDERSEPVVGDTVLLLMNAHDAAIPLMLPRLTAGQRWERVLDTTPEPLPFAGEPPYALQGRPMAILHTTRQHTQAWQAFGTAAVVER